MSERKSAEIKFRCTPTFKAGVQVAAEAAGQSMSEYIETAVWAHQNAKLDGTSLTGNAIKALGQKDGAAIPIVIDETAKAMRSYRPIPVGTVTLNGPVKEGDIVRDRKTGDAFLGTKNGAEDEPPVDAEGNALACTCRPWEFCTHKATG